MLELFQHANLHPLCMLSMLFDLGVCLVVLFARIGKQPTEEPPRSVPFKNVILATFAVGFVYILKLPLLRRSGLDTFGVLHLLYLDLVVLFPLAGLSVFISGWWKRNGIPLRQPTRNTKITAIVAMLLFPVGIYSTFIEPYWVKEEIVPVVLAKKRSGKEIIRIGVLSDIQTGLVTDYEHSVIDRMMELKPDIILMPGDLFHGSEKQFQEQAESLNKLMAKLSAPGGVYFVIGDCDSKKWMDQVFKNTQVKLLNNEAVSIGLKDRTVVVGGIEFEFRKQRARDFVYMVENNKGTEDIRVLFAHYPDAVAGMSVDSRIDVFVAGHTHGGQVVVPFFGPPITLSQVPRDVAAGGLHWMDGRRIYVSRGIGCERSQAIQKRFLCRPELTILELQ